MVEIEPTAYSASGFGLVSEDDAHRDSDEYETYLVIR